MASFENESLTLFSCSIATELGEVFEHVEEAKVEGAYGLAHGVGSHLLILQISCV